MIYTAQPERSSFRAGLFFYRPFCLWTAGRHIFLSASMGICLPSRWVARHDGAAGWVLEAGSKAGNKVGTLHAKPPPDARRRSRGGIASLLCLRAWGKGWPRVEESRGNRPGSLPPSPCVFIGTRQKACLSFWRRHPDSNWGWSFCRALPYHLAMSPYSHCMREV